MRKLSPLFYLIVFCGLLLISTPQGNIPDPVVGTIVQTHFNNVQMVTTNDTLQNLKEFLIRDLTPEHVYNSSSFTCLDFCEAFYKNASAEGFKNLGLAILHYKNVTTSHAVMTFSDVDGTTYFIETEINRFFNPFNDGSLDVIILYPDPENYPYFEI